MQRYSITRALGLPEHKIIGIFSNTEKEIHIRIRAYKRKNTKCSGCGESRDPNKVHRLKEVVDWLKLRCQVTNRLAEEIYRLTPIESGKIFEPEASVIEY